MRVTGLALVLTMSVGLWPMAAQAEQLAGSLEQALTGHSATASDVQLISHREYSVMEQRLHDMELRMASVETASCCEGISGGGYASAGGCCDAACGNGCGSACGGNGCGYIDNWCNVCPGVTFMAEILFLRSYDSFPDSDDTEYETGSRYEIGYMNECGRSWRVRYFEFADPDFSGTLATDYLHLEYIDIEYAGRFTLGCNWRGELSGGLRWAHYDQPDFIRYDDTIGLVIGGQLRGPCFFGLESYSIARHSLQFGTDEVSDNYGTFSITELQLGLEYQACVCGGIGFARTFLEAQSWQGPENGFSEDLGLFGFGFALGVTR